MKSRGMVNRLTFLLLAWCLFTAFPALAAGTVVPLTVDPAEQMNPAFHGNKVVWEDLRNGNRDIYLYDLATLTESPVVVASGDQRYPDLYLNRVVWEDWRNGNGDIYLYDLVTRTETPITTNPAGQGKPAIWQDKIVWQDARNGNLDIYLYDLATGTERALTTEPGIQSEPAIDQNRVVWVDYQSGLGYSLRLYDLASGTASTIVASPNAMSAPAINGNVVAWAQFDPLYMVDEVWMCDLSTSQVTRMPGSTLGPDVYQNKLVWMAGDYQADIILYDLATATRTQLSEAPSDNYHPAIYDGKVVWAGKPINYTYAYDYNIYLWTPDIVPKVTATDPANFARGVPVEKTIVATFNEPLQAGYALANVTVAAGGTTVACASSVSGNQLFIDPVASLAPATLYTVTIPAGAVKDATGNFLLGPYAFKFTTVDTIPPAVVSINPPDGATGVPVRPGETFTVTVTFSEDVKTGPNPAGVTVTANSVAIPATWEIGTVNPKALYIYIPYDYTAYSTTYAVRIARDAITDIDGNAMASDFTSSFRTENDTYPPKLTYSYPGPDATGVPVTVSLTLDFSEKIQPGPDYAAIKLVDQSNKAAGYSAAINGARLTITPSKSLSYNTTYTLTIPATAIVDPAGNPLAAPITLRFTTQAK